MSQHYKTYWSEWKGKYNISKMVGGSYVSAGRDSNSIKCLYCERKRSQLNDLSFYHNKLEKKKK